MKLINICVGFTEALNDLVICRIDRTSGRVKGGDEIFLLCEKITRGKLFIWADFHKLQ